MKINFCSLADNEDKFLLIGRHDEDKFLLIGRHDEERGYKLPSLPTKTHRGV